FAGDAGSVLVVGAGGYATLAAALADARNGDTILVTGDTVLREQVRIDGFADLTILGMDGATIEMPDGFVLNQGGMGPHGRAAVISVTNSSGITISNIDVDGRGLDDVPAVGVTAAVAGIFVGNSTAAIDGVDVTGTVNGTQRGEGIVVLNTDG